MHAVHDLVTTHPIWHRSTCVCTYTQRQVINVSVGLSGVEAPASGTEKTLCPGARRPSCAGTNGPFQVA